MDPVTTFLLGVLVSVLVMMGGWYLTKKADDARSRREGNFDQPVLKARVLGFDVPSDVPLHYTYVLEDEPGSPVMANITLGVTNTGKRAAEDVLLIASYPDLSYPKGLKSSIETPGLFPGREVKREKVGRLQQMSLYLPHLTPGASAEVVLAIPLDETRVTSIVEMPSSESDLPVKVAFQLEYALMFNVQLVSKERIWPGASARIRVTHGTSLPEVAGGVRDRVCKDDRESFGINQGGYAARALSAFRYWRFRHRAGRQYHFVLPALRSTAGPNRTSLLIADDNSSSGHYVMIDAGREWVLFPYPMLTDSSRQSVESVPLPPARPLAATARQGRAVG